MLAQLQRAQDQIVTRQKLAELGELAAGVAHEIKNPLNFMRNFVVLNMVNNSCYATDEKRLALGVDNDGFLPKVWLQTARKVNSFEIRVRDNGTGIEPVVIARYSIRSLRRSRRTRVPGWSEPRE